MKLCTLFLAALLAAGALSAQAQEAPVAAAGRAPPSPKSRIISMIDSGLHGYNSSVATATCLVTVRGAGPASDSVGTAIAALLNTDDPVISWEQDGALHSAFIYMNFTSASPVGDASTACRTIQTRLPKKLRAGASVATNTFSYAFDPRRPAKKGACSWLCNKFCKRTDRKCNNRCTVAGWGCKGVCYLLPVPRIICMFL